MITGQTELCYFDSLAVAASGNVCVANHPEERRHGRHHHHHAGWQSTFTEIPDPFVTNIAFGGADMKDAYIAPRAPASC